MKTWTATSKFEIEKITIELFLLKISLTSPFQTELSKENQSCKEGNKHTFFPKKNHYSQCLREQFLNQGDFSKVNISSNFVAFSEHMKNEKKKLK